MIGPPKRIIVVGAAGQDGRILASLLSNTQNEVIGVVSKPSQQSALQGYSKVIHSDFTNPKESYKVLSQFYPDVIFHFAAVHGGSLEMKTIEGKFGESMRRCHVDMTKNILDWQLKNKYCKSIIALSSFIYTPRFANEEITKTSPLNPQGYYGKTKLEAFELIKFYRLKFNLQTSGLILFNHSSKFSKKGFLLPTIAKQLVLSDINQQPLHVINSEKLVDISNAKNFCEGFAAIITSEFVQDWFFSSGQTRTVRSLYEGAAKVLGIESNSLITFDRRGGDIPSMYGNIDETKKLLSWQGGGDAIEVIKELFLEERALSLDKSV